MWRPRTYAVFRVQSDLDLPRLEVAFSPLEYDPSIRFGTQLRIHMLLPSCGLIDDARQGDGAVDPALAEARRRWIREALDAEARRRRGIREALEAWEAVAAESEEPEVPEETGGGRRPRRGRSPRSRTSRRMRSTPCGWPRPHRRAVQDIGGTSLALQTLPTHSGSGASHRSTSTVSCRTSMAAGAAAAEEVRAVAVPTWERAAALAPFSRKSFRGFTFQGSRTRACPRPSVPKGRFRFLERGRIDRRRAVSH